MEEKRESVYCPYKWACDDYRLKCESCSHNGRRSYYIEKESMQRYAMPDGKGWTVYEAPLPCHMGEGNIIASGLSYEEAGKLLEGG